METRNTEKLPEKLSEQEKTEEQLKNAEEARVALLKKIIGRHTEEISKVIENEKLEWESLNYEDFKNAVSDYAKQKGFATAFRTKLLADMNALVRNKLFGMSMGQDEILMSEIGHAWSEKINIQTFAQKYLQGEKRRNCIYSFFFAKDLTEEMSVLDLKFWLE